MSIEDFVERFQENDNLHERKSFLDFVIYVENHIEQAEDYGLSLDLRMFDLISDLSNIDEVMSRKAKESNEDFPPTDYFAKIKKITTIYFFPIVQKEINRIKQGILNDGFNDYWNGQIDNLKDKILMMKEIFSDLDISDTLNDLTQLQSKK